VHDLTAQRDKWQEQAERLALSQQPAPQQRNAAQRQQTWWHHEPAD
jgi:hypothetical protein